MKGDEHAREEYFVLLLQGEGKPVDDTKVLGSGLVP